MQVAADQSMDVKSLDQPLTEAQAIMSRLWPVIVATTLGMVVVFGVGFAPGIAHNAAHDTRHALIFPCH